MVSKKITYLLIFLFISSLSGDGSVKADEINSSFYPDLRLTENIFLAGNKALPDETVHLKPSFAVEIKDGKCAIELKYEIYNRGAISVNQRFFSMVKLNNEKGSSRLISGIGADEKLEINDLVWLLPGEESNIIISVDNFDNVKEVSDQNNSKEINLQLVGSCVSDEVIEEKNKERGLFEGYEHRVQDHELYKK